MQHKQTSWRDCQDPYCTLHLDKKEKELSFVRPTNYDATLQRRQVAEELASNPKEYDPLWKQVLNEEASEEEGAPVLEWRRQEWNDLEDYDDFKNGILSWLGPWEAIMEDEVTCHSVTNWKRRYTFNYKKEQLRKKFGDWVELHLPNPPLYKDGWDEEWEKKMIEEARDWDYETGTPRKPKNDKAPRQ